MVTIIFESHATSLDNEAGLSSGCFDVELSELGKAQAGELGERYKDNSGLAAVFCSDLKRSYNTAEIAFRSSGISIIKDKRLRECDYGDLTRRPTEEVFGPHRGEYVTKPFPNGQSYEQTTQLIKGFLAEALEKYNGNKIMIVGSRATQYGLENLINKVPLKEAVTAPWQWQPGWTYNLEKI